MAPREAKRRQLRGRWCAWIDSGMKRFPSPSPEDAADAAEVAAGDRSRPFRIAVRVYHEDTDGSGAVYHANYLKFLERARTEWLRSLGFEQPALAAGHGIAFVVRSLAIDYLVPARFNDALAVTVELAELRGGQLVLTQRAVRGERTLAVASVRIACVNTASFRPARIPRGVAAALARCAVLPMAGKESR